MFMYFPTIKNDMNLKQMGTNFLVIWPINSFLVKKMIMIKLILFS